MRSNLTAPIKRACWENNCGSVFNAKCFVGCGTVITPFSYDCGHINSVANGGTNELANLKPVCPKCNKSMGSTNMIEYIKSCRFSPEWLLVNNIKLTVNGVLIKRPFEDPLPAKCRIVDFTKQQYIYVMEYPLENTLEIKQLKNGLYNIEYVAGGMFKLADSICEITKLDFSDEIFEHRPMELIIQDIKSGIIGNYQTAEYAKCKCLASAVLIIRNNQQQLFIKSEFVSMKFDKKELTDLMKKYRLKIIEVDDDIDIKLSENFVEVK